jgi:hypothetical protein
MGRCDACGAVEPQLYHSGTRTSRLVCERCLDEIEAGQLPWPVALAGYLIVGTVLVIAGLIIARSL